MDSKADTSGAFTGEALREVSFADGDWVSDVSWVPRNLSKAFGAGEK